MTGAGGSLKFIVGSRTLWAPSVRLKTLSYSLDDLIDGRLLPFPDAEGDDGYRVLSAPAEILDRLPSGFAVGGVQRYRRYFIDMSGDYAAYLGQFSSKTRSTFARKRRKLIEASGGTLDIRFYRTPAEIGAFLALALPLSRRTYQGRLLDAGLPEDGEAHAMMAQLAADDRVRAYLLFLDGKPVSYLYLPIDDDVLVYANLGYAPEAAGLSVGTVLQLEALEQLFAESRYRYFDFTEGQGAHKAMFGSDSREAVSFYMVRKRSRAHALIAMLDGFDQGVAAVKAVADRAGVAAKVRQLLRR